jgi:hypothetical protein
MLIKKFSWWKQKEVKLFCYKYISKSFTEKLIAEFVG